MKKQTLKFGLQRSLAMALVFQMLGGPTLAYAKDYRTPGEIENDTGGTGTTGPDGSDPLNYGNIPTYDPVTGSSTSTSEPTASFDVEKACKRIREGLNQKPTGTDGQPLAMPKVNGKELSLKETCANAAYNTQEKYKKFCALRSIAMNTQATYYCDAYEESKKAKKGLMWTAIKDAAASAVCLRESIALSSNLKKCSAKFSGLDGERKAEYESSKAATQNGTRGTLIDRCTQAKGAKTSWYKAFGDRAIACLDSLVPSAEAKNEYMTTDGNRGGQNGSYGTNNGYKPPKVPSTAKTTNNGGGDGTGDNKPANGGSALKNPGFGLNPSKDEDPNSVTEKPAENPKPTGATTAKDEMTPEEKKAFNDADEAQRKKEAEKQAQAAKDAESNQQFQCPSVEQEYYSCLDDALRAPQNNLCGGAALVAGVTEIFQMKKIQKEQNTKVSKDGELKDTANDKSLLSIASAYGPAVEGLRIASCYYADAFGSGKDVCPYLGFSKKVHSGENAETKIKARIRLDNEASLAFAAIAAVRAGSMIAAGATNKNSKKALEGLFSDALTSGVDDFNTSPSGTGGGRSVVAVNGANGSGTLTSGNGSVSTAAATGDDMEYANGYYGEATAGDTPLMGKTLGGHADQMARAFSGDKRRVAAAVAGGADGILGSMMGAAGVGEAYKSNLKDKVSDLLAQLGVSNASYASTGGGKSSFSAGGSGFAPMDSGLAGSADSSEFRKPAAAMTVDPNDIWHTGTSDNLFQIISNKYTNVHMRVSR